MVREGAVIVGFYYQFVLSPWVWETLYSRMMQRDGYHTMASKRFLNDVMVEAAEDEGIVERALEIAERLVGENNGN